MEAPEKKIASTDFRVLCRLFVSQVYPMYKAFIEPDLETAHIRITNSFNPFSGFQNATYVLKVINPTHVLGFKTPQTFSR